MLLDEGTGLSREPLPMLGEDGRILGFLGSAHLSIQQLSDRPPDDRRSAPFLDAPACPDARVQSLERWKIDSNCDRFHIESVVDAIRVIKLRRPGGLPIVHRPWSRHTSSVPRVLGSAVGIVLLAGLAFGAAVLLSHSFPRSDVALVVHEAPVLLAGEGATRLQASLGDGFDASRVVAELDGRHPLRAAVTSQWAGSRLDVAIPPLTPGAHVVRAGIVHRGPVDRRVPLPFVVGPFAARGVWLPRSAELVIGPRDVDDGDPRTTTDLASALETALSSRLVGVSHPTIGRAQRADVRITLDHATQTIGVRATVHFAGARVHGAVSVRLERTGDRSLAIRTASPVAISVELGNLSGVGSAVGSQIGGNLVPGLGDAIGGILGAIGGQAADTLGLRSTVEAMATDIARQEVQRLLDAWLARLSSAMLLPESVPAGDYARVALRYADTPRLDATRGLVITLDARVVAPDRAGVGPLVFSHELPPSTPDRRSHLRASPALVAAIADAWARSGALERRLNGAIGDNAESLRRLRPLVLVSVHRPQVLLERRVTQEGRGRLAWSIPEVELRTNLARDVRVFARGTMTPEVGPDATSVRVRLDVDDVAIGCRRRLDNGGVSVETCLTDATTAIPDIPARVNRLLGPVDVLGDALGSIQSLATSDGTVRLTIRPTAVSVGTPDGEPAVDLTVSIAVDAAQP
ncbi:MAG: hypothetical protein IT379_09585 [Deltaproteobacteria bacterium]|nr:hypothetical protein [Deltaproteobacteria bacterium]